MNSDTTSLLSQHELHYETTDDSELRKLLGQWKHQIRGFIQDNDSQRPSVKFALRRIFKTK